MPDALNSASREKRQTRARHSREPRPAGTWGGEAARSCPPPILILWRSIGSAQSRVTIADRLEHIVKALHVRADIEKRLPLGGLCWLAAGLLKSDAPLREADSISDLGDLVKPIRVCVVVGQRDGFGDAPRLNLLA